MSRAIASSASHWPQPDWQRTEDRFWVWVHYAATKLARGELYEALDCLTFLRGTVLAPLAATARGRNARGVRFLERDLPDVAVALRATIAGYDEKEIRAAVTATIAFYRGLREESAPPTLVQREAAERAAVAFLGGA